MGLTVAKGSFFRFLSSTHEDLYGKPSSSRTISTLDGFEDLLYIAVQSRPSHNKISAVVTYSSSKA